MMKLTKCSMCGKDIMCDDVMYIFPGIPGIICKECIENVEGYTPSDFEKYVMDTVEVIRCKNCIYYKFGDMTIDNMYCCWAKEMYKNIYKIPMIAMEPNDYCSHGVRKR